MTFRMVKQNPDKEFVVSIRKQLKDNNGYCPCSLEKTPDTKCMCKEFREMIANGDEGACHCGLYIIEKQFALQ